jgi:hypothetical protein
MRSQTEGVLNKDEMRRAEKKYPKEEMSLCYIPTREETVTLLKV